MYQPSKGLQGIVSLLSASDPEAIERCGTRSRFGVWMQVIPLVVTPIFGFLGATFAAFDVMSATS